MYWLELTAVDQHCCATSATRRMFRGERDFVFCRKLLLRDQINVGIKSLHEAALRVWVAATEGFESRRRKSWSGFHALYLPVTK